jgi:putative membrane protein
MVKEISSRNTIHDSRITLIIKGVCMGAADVIPGVSGGTMALILGIYQRLVDAIKSFDLAWLKGIFRLDFRIIFNRPHFGFLIPLCIGIAFSLFFFTRVISLPMLLQTHPEPIYGLFFGLIAGSILILLEELRQGGPINYLVLLAGIVAGFLVFNMVPMETSEAGWFIFLSGALAICAMILPGISGSFILLMLKKYAYIFNAIGYLQFSVLIPFALGAATGLVLFSRFLSFLLHDHYRATMLVITGILMASLWVIWPFQERVYGSIGSEQHLITTSPYIPDISTPGLLFAMGMVMAGFLLVLLVHYIANYHMVVEE